jgi:predicted nicotinamide N-methyase
MSILPAHATKNNPLLLYPVPPPLTQTLHLTQNSLAATTTGATLWLGAQVLTAYLYTLYTPSSASTKLALDLGAGIGLASLALGALGFEVTATDVAELAGPGGLLRSNIESPKNSTAGRVAVRELDWFQPPPREELLVGGKEFDVVMTADTIYAPELVVPLFETITRFAGAKTQVWIALEVRDEELIRGALKTAQEMGFGVKKIPQGKLKKAMAAAKMEWGAEDWAGVEVWKLSVAKRKE